MIAIIDYEMGNVGSIKNMFSRIGVESIITSNVEDLFIAKGIILPGVGAFEKAMEILSDMEIFPVLNELVLVNKKPILGICLGMQVMAKNSEEGELLGLGWVDAEVKKLSFNNNNEHLKIPHMGWNEIIPVKSSSLLTGLQNNSRFYFTHSYCIVPKVQEDILTTTYYGKNFVSAIEKGNIYGVQFHPEKSHKYGMKILQNFANVL